MQSESVYYVLFFYLFVTNLQYFVVEHGCSVDFGSFHSASIDANIQKSTRQCDVSI